MSPASFLRFLLGALLVAGPSPSWAALPDEIQVYTDDMKAPGESGVELHMNSTPSGRAAPGYPGEVTAAHGLRVTPEISRGFMPGVDGAIYLPFVRSAQGTTYFAGPRFRLKWMPLRPADGGAFAGVNVELSFVDRRFEEARRTMEIRPIFGYRNDDWLFSFNPIIDTNLARPEKGVLTFSPAYKVARGIGSGNALGVEYYSDLGRLSRFAPRAEQSHAVFLVLDTKKLNFGIGRGFQAADRWTVKGIYSF